MTRAAEKQRLIESKLARLTLRQIEMLAHRIGAEDSFMADFLGVHVDVWKLWLKQHPEFTEQFDGWRKSANDRVVRSLFERAVGFRSVEEKYERTGDLTALMTEEGDIAFEPEYRKTITVKQVAADVKACEVWLYNREPEDWKRQIQVDVEVSQLGSAVLESRKRLASRQEALTDGEEVDIGVLE